MKTDYTKQILTLSLKKIMKQKPLDKINIREITEDCGLNRQTFYYHFSDIYNQVEWMFEQDIMELLQRYKGEEVWREGLMQVFDYFRENKEVCYCALKSSGREYLQKYFHARVLEIVRNTIENICEERKTTLDEDYKDMLVDYYTLSFSSVIENWVYGHINRTPEELVEFFDCMIRDHISGISQRLESKEPTDPQE